VADHQSSDRLSLSDLVAQTGVPPSTIHHYRRTGLIPAPERLGANRFVYDQCHVDAILAARHRPAAEYDDIRMRIVAAAVDAFKNGSYVEVSMADIAQTLGMAKGNLYRYFVSKEALLTAALEAVLDETTERFGTVVEQMGGAAGMATDPERSVLALGYVVADVLPMLLELGARAAKGHEPSALLARRVLRTLAATAGRPFIPEGLDDSELAIKEGLNVIQRAFATVLTWSVGEDWPPDDLGVG
jgi:AcrR family transcriptional regulator